LCKRKRRASTIKKLVKIIVVCLCSKENATLEAPPKRR
jgi:hypothetical protein